MCSSRSLTAELPVEILLRVVDYLDSVADILHLQQTCKLFDNLIDKSTDVWRSYLRRQCAQHELFTPSYNELTSPSDFKKAATSSFRFVKAHGRGATSDYMSTSYHKLELSYPPIDAKRRPEPVPLDATAIWIIPGGRYLITLGSQWLSVWDLKEIPVPTLLLRFPIKHCLFLLYAKVVDDQTIRILYEVEVDNTNPAFAGDTKYEYVWLDLKLSKQKQWSARITSQISLSLPVQFVPFKLSLLREKIVIVFEDRRGFSSGISFLWDHVSNRYTCWRADLPDLANLSQVILRDDYILYLCHIKGIYGVKVPSTNHQVMSDECINLWPILSPVQPDFYTRNDPSNIGGDFALMRLTRSAGFRIQTIDDKSFNYEFCQKQVNGEPMIHRYHFSLDAEDPSKSVLKPLDSLAFRGPNPDLTTLYDLSGKIYEICDSSIPMAVIWTNKQQASISLLPSLADTMSKDVSNPKTEVKLVPWGEYVHAPPGLTEKYSLCPASGMFAVLWYDEDGRWEIDSSSGTGVNIYYPI
ncbi:hypothetical protein DFP72DRAFT_1171772 [Ephemerocybe angulata]|uniref:F-box domain-containing protein n=1 Tax=Ephemerocybe angulata TaxID=980116 RepID=A0A8H6HTX0_9AGAR|nr:hypothetical protein DFP72DRAFT_1171772 [Tulosesus angulatus]